MLVKIPVIKATLKIYSKDIEKISILTKLILHAIASGINVNRIEDIVNLPKRLIMENVEELEKRGIIIGDYNGNYKLTEVGIRNFNLLNEIEEMNKKEIEVFVDSYTKHIFTQAEVEYRYIDENQKIKDEKVVEIARNKYMKQYLNNLDPSNSRELVLKMLNNVETQDKENISVEVKMINERGGYIVGKVKEKIVKKNEKSKLGSDIIIKREIYKNTYTPVFDSLKKIKKESMEALVTLGNNNFDFISDKGLEILEKNKASKTSFVYYYDPKNEEISSKKIKSEIKENEIKSKAVLDMSSQEENIKLENVENVKILKEKYGKDISFKINTEKEYVYERFAIEDVIDIYEGVENE